MVSGELREDQGSASAHAGGSSDVLVAVKNAVILGGSLLTTWSIALLARIFLPRALGPERFGSLSFAEGFSTAAFVVLGLGADMYIRREIPVRPRHASDFFGGLLVLRLALSALVFGAMALVLGMTGRSPMVLRTVFIFGVAQVLTVQNSTMSAMLQASCTVKGLAVTNVWTKLLWGVCVGLILVARVDIWGLAVAVLVVEAVRAILLFRLVRRHLGLQLRWSLGAVRAVVLASLPFYLHHVAGTAHAKVDVSLLAILSNDTEVGWYGAASNLAALSFLISPLVAWVLLPLLARSKHRSEQEMFGILRWTARALFVIALPMTLVIGLGADIWVRLLFGGAFAPAVLSLQILAPMLVATYLAMIASSCLIILGRAWTVTILSTSGLLLNLALNGLLVPRAMQWLGPGGAGAGAATALVVAEVSITVALFGAIGARAFDRASAWSLVGAVASALFVVVVDRLLRPLGAVRLALDVVVYVALLAALRVVKANDVQQMRDIVRSLMTKRARPPASGAEIEPHL